ncbi:tRNA pseudouridine(13) synthase TruD [Alteromonas gilva]|uniref:tRNA pseudouridine synthase D n=1 Tax=Alteromonas gilva TaxID=2987522 RepID=A0ABT5L7T7_9ALTE|nr:tRNA pseudouridine(13) synthase TruD [Alteromonas gilva]MDC8833099.1 tRNA pseudouridine(13) synthase TruD [Alteromonas gilva]
MIALDTSEWQYLFGQPTSTGLLKQQLTDFKVREHLGYKLTGEGEHIYIELEKAGLNTAYVAEQLASFCKLPLRQVTYAGRKDKYAVTQQWFGIHLPGKAEFDWSGFTLAGTRILHTQRHNKKLRTGQLKGNTFTITLREVSDPEQVIERLHRAADEGVPNYFGSQRFGVQRISEQGETSRGGNLLLAERMLNGEVIKNRNKRSMALSALRSWLFNDMLSARISAGLLTTVNTGDVVNLSGSNSIFVAEEDCSELNRRLQERDLSTTVPLWGDGKLDSLGQALAFEQELAEQYSALTAYLASQRLTQDRRAAIIWPQQLECDRQGDTLIVSFFLPPGCFATSVLRECLNTIELA